MCLLTGTLTTFLSEVVWFSCVDKVSMKHKQMRAHIHASIHGNKREHKQVLNHYAWFVLWLQSSFS